MEVRWNSTLAQLLGLQRLEPALRHLFESGHSTSAWSEQVWLAMRDTIKILNGFKDVSDHLQGRSFPTISAAAEGYIIMNKGLEELRAASTLTPWGMEVLALFDTWLTEYREHLIDTLVVQWATILDPSMKAEVIRADGGNDLRYIISELEYHFYQLSHRGYEQLRPKLFLCSDLCVRKASAEVRCCGARPHHYRRREAA
ncbi:unnamed protein product [Tilletia laevis]|uniref:Uncharacterized protein n=1 Tax=Tilletia laevis TaxID=157183 RepID=A0A9N8M7I0_9BASI|nr:unnamed protein product [Tilletia laevis]